jgi:hypothetical protein
VVAAIVADVFRCKSGIDVAARSTVLYAVQLRGRTMASGFRCRYVPNALSTGWHTKNRAVIEARPGRDSFPLLQQRMGFNRKIVMPLLRATGTVRRWTTTDATRQQAYARPPWWLSWFRCARPALVPSFAMRRAALIG